MHLTRLLEILLAEDGAAAAVALVAVCDGTAVRNVVRVVHTSELVHGAHAGVTLDASYVWMP